MRRIRAALAVAVVALPLWALVGAGPASGASLPAAMAALGDSLTQAYGAGGGGQNYPAESWSTGTDSAVSSHYLRLLPSDPALSGHAYNDAVSGTSMASTATQASSAVSQGATYVTLWSGTNDVCTTTTSQMTSVSTYSSQLQSTLTRLGGISGVQVLVLSIPDWSTFWTNWHTNANATSAWATYSNRCPDLLSSSATAADRSAVGQRIHDLNGALASVCGQFSFCRYDGGATFNLWGSLTQSDLAFDWFHLTASGEAKVAAAAWQAGFFSQPAGTLGKTTVGSLSEGGGGNWLDSSGPYTLGAAGSITKLTAYVRGSSSPTPVRTVVYADGNGKPGALVAVSQQVTIAAGQGAGWVDFPLSSPVGVGTGKYWLGFWYGSSTGVYYYDSVAGSEAYTPDTYSATGTPNNPYGSNPGISASQYSIYATLTTSSGSPPSSTGAPAISGQATQGQTLTVSQGSWSGSPTGFAYQWQSCDSGGNGCSGIGGATSSSYVVVSGDVGHTLRAQVTATNQYGSVAATSTATAVVQASGTGATFGRTTVGTSTTTGGANWLDSTGPYTIGSAVSVTKLTAYLGGGSASAPLRTVVYADSGGKPGALVAVSQQVTIAAGQAAGWVDFPLSSPASLGAGKYWLGFWIGGSAATYYYVPVAGVEAFTPDSYSATGTPNNPYGSSPGVSDNSFSLYATFTASTGGGGSQPASTAAPAISGTAQQGKTLTVSNGTWSGSPTGFAYQWQSCDSGGNGCSGIGGATSGSYVVAAGDVGHTLRAQVTATNQYGSATATSGATGVVQGTSSATLGKTTVGGLTVSGGTNYLDASGPYALAAGMTVTKLTGYVGGGSSSTPLRAVIYADNGGKPGAPVAVSQQVTIAAGQAAGWVDFPLPAAISLGSGSYWLGYWIGGPSAIYYYDAVAGSEAYTADAYSATGSPNNPFGTPGTSSSSYSLFTSSS